MVQRLGTKASTPSWLPEAGACVECRSLPFAELPGWARACREWGVEELLLTAWEGPGPAGGLPRFAPDPALGGPSAFGAALQACAELGVKVLVSFNLPYVDSENDWYRQELYRYRCEDRWGVLATILGWPDAGGLARSQGTGRRRLRLNPAAPGLAHHLAGQIEDLARLGVDGLFLSSFFGRWISTPT